MLRRCAAAAVLAVVAPLPGASAAPGLALWSSGEVGVASDLSACATVAFDGPVTGAGSFSAAGAAAGPGTIVGAVRGVRPIVLSGDRSWYGCVAGAYAGAVVGEATYVLSVSTSDGDFTQVVHCSVRSGAVTCL